MVYMDYENSMIVPFIIFGAVLRLLYIFWSDILYDILKELFYNDSFKQCITEVFLWQKI